MLGGHDYDTIENGAAPRPRVSAAPGLLVVALVVLGAAGWAVTQFGGPVVAAAARVVAPVPAATSRPKPSAHRAVSMSGRPTLMMFTADWCGPCQSFKRTVLAHSKVSAKIDESVRFEKVDLTRRGGPNAETAQRYGVRGIPALVLVDTRGREIDRYQGATDPEQFLRWLDRHTP